jgi:hypothetical protein
MSKRVDDNQKEIVRGLRAVGAEVLSLANLGKGAPDLLVCFRKVWYVAELKDGSKSPSRRKLTAAETEWHQRFGQQASVHIWTSLDEALKTIGAITPIGLIENSPEDLCQPESAKL